MSDWSALLSGLSEGPRENGSAELGEAAAFLAQHLRSAGLEPRLQGFEAHPYEPTALALGVFLLCCGYAFALQRSRWAAALGVAVVLLALPVLHLDWGLPLTPGLSVSADNVVAVVPAQRPEQRLILTAHYDTKTELTDHVVRIPVQLAGFVLGVLAFAVPAALIWGRERRWVRGTARALVVVAPVYGLVFLAVFAGGHLRSDRSAGALDDGAACAVLLRTAQDLAGAPPPIRTEVVFLFLAAEEVGAQGSWRFVEDLLPTLAPLPTRVVNLDPIGASEALTVVHREGLLLRTFAPAPEVVAVLDAVHREQTGRPIDHTAGGGLTDAFPFLANGVPAATILSAVPPFVIPRGMHTPADGPERIDPASLDAALDFVLRLVRFVDRGPEDAASAERAER